MPDFRALFAPAAPVTDFAALFAPEEEKKRPLPPMYDANNIPIDRTAPQPEAPQPSLADKISEAYTLANEHPAYAIASGIAKVVGAKNPESYGRDAEALINSLGPLGAVELPPVAKAPAAVVDNAPLGVAKVAAAKPPLKTTAMRRAESRLNYMRAKDAGVSISPGSYQEMVAGMTHKMREEGIDPQLTPDSYALMRRFISNVDTGGKADAMKPITGVEPRAPSKEMSLEELDILRKQAGAATQSIKPADRRLAVILRDRLDDFLEKATPADFGIKAGPNAREGIEALKLARKQWAEMSRSETIDTMLRNADIRAGNLNGSNLSGLRTEFRQLAMKISRDKREAAKWRPEQQKIINELASATSIPILLSRLSRLSPRHYFSMTGGLGLSYFGSPLLTGAGWALGEGAHQLGSALANQKINQLRGTIGE